MRAPMMVHVICVACLVVITGAYVFLPGEPSRAITKLMILVLAALLVVILAMALTGTFMN